MSDPLLDRTIARIVKVLDGMTVHTFSAPWGDNYWDRTLDANSKHKIAEAVARMWVGPPAGGTTDGD